MAEQKNKEIQQKSCTIAFSYLDSQKEKLDEMAKNMGMSRSQIIRLCLDYCINNLINLPGISLGITELCQQIQKPDASIDEKTYQELLKIINNLVSLFS